MNQRNQLLLFILIIFGISAWYLTYKKQKIANKKAPETIIVGTNVEYPPFSFMEDDTIVGFDIDVVREVVEKRLGKKMQLKQMAFDALIPEIQLGTIHIIAAGMTPTEERAQRIFFTKPHLSDDPLLLVSLAATPVKTIDELKDKQVIVNEGYTADYYIATIKGPEIIRLTTSQVSDGMLALKSKQGHAFVASKSALQPYFDKHGTQGLNIVTIEGVTDKYALAISKKYPELVKQVQKALDDMTTDGTLDEIKNKWKLA